MQSRQSALSVINKGVSAYISLSSTSIIIVIIIFIILLIRSRTHTKHIQMQDKATLVEK